MLRTTGIHLGLIGKSLSHSFSKDYFEKRFEVESLQGCSYGLFEMPSLEGLRNQVETFSLDGFNVTIPYKVEILPLLDSIDPVAAQVGAVNTVKVDRTYDGALHLCGYNTDAPAFLDTIRPLLAPHHRQALILGTGGASKAVAWALQQLGIKHLFVSRTPDGKPQTIGYDDPQLRDQSNTIIVNTTPVGMYPDCNASPWPYPNLLTPSHLCYDLVYNPSPTLFLKHALGKGAATKDGLGMLHRQADLAWQIWTNET